ncbi:energy transducer TonB [Tenacibaculum sp.]|nr:energy transducer TonB [Tenacibaculum sp.]
MRKQLFLIVIFCFSLSIVVAQEVCESDEDSLDLNSITKCTVKESKKSNNKNSRQITVKVSAARSRYLKKRNTSKKLASSSFGNLNSAGVEKTHEDIEVAKKLILKSDIESIEKNLSKEELRKAAKFSTVDIIPSFSNCETSKRKERMKCFNEEMIKHIQKHFRYPGKAVKESIQGEVWVRFIIDSNGDIRNIKALGPKNAKILNNEAKRVVAQLPQFKPAKKDGKLTSVKYGFPITFSLEE